MLETTIAVLSDQNLFREEVVELLLRQGFPRVTKHRSATELLGALASAEPQLILIDLDHGAEDPLPLLRELRQRTPRATVVIIGGALQSAASQGDPSALPEALSGNAQVLRAVAGLSLAAEEEEAVLPALAREQQQRLWSTMTPRQRDVLGHLSTGSDNLKIAAHLGISERAVKAHVSALLSLFSAENRTELAVLACRAGMRPPLRSRPMPALRSQLQPRSA